MSDVLVYDVEVYQYDWFITVRNLSTSQYTKIHNNLPMLFDFYEKNKNNIWAGHNINHYDNLIVKLLLKGITGPELKECSNQIIEHDNGSKLIKKYNLNEITIYPMDVMQDAIRYSLKEVEGYLGMSIEETEVPFDIPRPLTKEEIDDVFKYNQHDVDATTEEIQLRLDRLKNKIVLLKEYNLPLDMIAYTNQQLCAEILQADYTKFDDGLQPYDLSVAPININKYKECIDFFTKCDKLDYSKELKIDIAGVPHVLSNGGIHGAIKNYYYIGEMWLIDVSSYYPNMMINFNLCSRTMKDPKNFSKLVDTRMKAKELTSKYKDLIANTTKQEHIDVFSNMEKSYKSKSDALKLPINTTSGAMKAKFSKLFDERNNNWLCITGQLLLVDLIESMEDYMSLIQSNTDGIIIIPHNKEMCDKKIKEWENKTGLILEKTIATKIFQKDVNNYVLLDNIGHVKAKGGFVAQYHNENRYQDMLRRNCEILDDAIVDYLLYQKSLEETIYNENNKLIKFQIIKKLGSMYTDIALVKYDDSEEYLDNTGINRVNRIFATTNSSYGKLLKKHKDKNKYDSVEGCPDNCLVINSDIRELYAKDIELDYSWYIQQAKEKIVSFLLDEQDVKFLKKEGYSLEKIFDEIIDK